MNSAAQTLAKTGILKISVKDDTTQLQNRTTAKEEAAHNENKNTKMLLFLRNLFMLKIKLIKTHHLQSDIKNTQAQ